MLLLFAATPLSYIVNKRITYTIYKHVAGFHYHRVLLVDNFVTLSLYSPPHLYSSHLATTVRVHIHIIDEKENLDIIFLICNHHAGPA